MNYLKIYSKIIRNARKERYLVNYELHHIVPKSYGGSNKTHNLVKLTLREHFIVHLLLTRNFKQCVKMKRAFNLMYYKLGKNSRKYEWTKVCYQYSITKESLIELLENNPGISKAKIAKFYNCDVSVIDNRFKTFGIEYQKLNINNVKIYIKENPLLTFEQIGKKFNVSGALISRYNKKYNLGLPIIKIRRNSEFDKDELVNLIDMKLNNSQIAEKMNISVDKLRSLLHFYELSNPNQKITKYEVSEELIIRYIKNTTVKSKKEIYEYFNIGATKLDGIIRRNNLPVNIKELNLMEVKEFIECHDSPTIQNIADEFGFGWDRVRNFVRKHKLL